MRVYSFSTEEDVGALSGLVNLLSKLDLCDENTSFYDAKTSCGQMYWFRFDDKSEDDD